MKTANYLTSKNSERSLKKLLAEELTIRIHSKDAHEAVKGVSQILFNKKATNEQLKALSEDAFQAISGEIPSFKVEQSVISNQVGIIDLLTEHSSICKSKSEARKAIQNNAIAINKIKVSDFNYNVSIDNLIQDKYLMIENGKKNKYLVSLK